MSIAQKITQWIFPKIADATDLFAVADALKAHYEKSGYYTAAIKEADLECRQAARDFDRLSAVTRQKTVGTIQDKKDAVTLDQACSEAQKRLDDAEVELDFAKGLKRDFEQRVGILQSLKGLAGSLVSLAGSGGEL